MGGDVVDPGLQGAWTSRHTAIFAPARPPRLGSGSLFTHLGHFDP
jgi:hypothetical protein